MPKIAKLTLKGANYQIKNSDFQAQNKINEIEIEMYR